MPKGSSAQQQQQRRQARGQSWSALIYRVHIMYNIPHRLSNSWWSTVTIHRRGSVDDWRARYFGRNEKENNSEDLHAVIAGQETARSARSVKSANSAKSAKSVKSAKSAKPTESTISVEKETIEEKTIWNHVTLNLKETRFWQEIEDFG